MGLLAPLFAIASLAIAAPILFHLIRRQPQGRVQFSSLMFLRTSPPRLTRKSRLDNLLLLLLRVLAIALIALAFSRPYWRQKELVNQSAPARTVALLLDTSASMQRPEAWQAALKQARQVLDGLSEEDTVTLFTIDNQLRTIVPLHNDTSAKSTEKRLTDSALVMAALQELKPTWNSSKLSTGLIGVAEQLNSQSLGTESKLLGSSQIVLISDFHQESGIEELQSYTWPEEIGVDLRIVGAELPGNARASLMQVDESPISKSSDLKIRVENNSHSRQEALTLQWLDAKANPVGPVTSIQVTAGQVRMITMPPRPENAVEVRLGGDGWSGDNDLYVPSTPPVVQRVLYCGTQSTQAEEDLGYFLSQAPLSNSMFRRQVEAIKPSELAAQAVLEDVVAIVIEPIPEVTSQIELLRSLIARGGNVLVVATELSASQPGFEQFLDQLLSDESVQSETLQLKVTESTEQQHSMIASVDYRSVVFASLADPRFNDFSKIRIWKHRKLSWQESVPADSPLEVLARLDDGSPWLVRRSIKNGNVWVLTSSWQTSESSFALSSKFIPVVSTLIDPNPRQTGFTRVVEVGELIAIDDSPPLTITNQLGQSIDSDSLMEGDRLKFTEPGLYSIRGSRWTQQLAVQVPASESKLVVMDGSVLQQFGLSSKRVQSDEQIEDRLRQMKIEEIEQQQKIWKWILVVGLGVLLIETFAAGWAAKKI